MRESRITLASWGCLNSSVACFWMHQLFHDKGNGGYGGGIANEDWERFYATDNKWSQFPLPDGPWPVDEARRLDGLASELAGLQPAAVCGSGTPSRARLDAARVEGERVFSEMVGCQEELDWTCLH